MSVWRSRRRVSAILLAAAVIALTGCNDDDDKKPTEPDPVDGVVAADFTLPDVNPNSATYQQPISPDEYPGEVSCWYFVAAT